MYVDSTPPGGGGGFPIGSPENPYVNLQDAIDRRNLILDDVEIRMFGGDYDPDNVDIPSETVIKGGYGRFLNPIDGATVVIRDIAQFHTIFDSSLPGGAVSDPFIRIEGVFGVTVSGIRFTRGNSGVVWGDSVNVGGSVGVRIEDCVFYDAEPGGQYAPLHIENATIAVRDCRFVRNEGAGLSSAFGGAISIIFNQFGYALIQRCEFSDNTGVSGGAIYANVSEGVAAIVQCEFEGNHAMPDGGGAPGFGGAIFVTSLGQEDNGAVIVANSLFAENESDGTGGAIHVENGTFSATNVTIANNTAPTGGAIYYRGNFAGVFLYNSILWDNPGSPSEIESLAGIINHTVRDSILTPGTDPGTAINVLFEDPKFVTPGSDRRLGATSPALDTASYLYYSLFWTLADADGSNEDLNRNDRVVDFPKTGPIGAYPLDMGCYETAADYEDPPNLGCSPADFTGDFSLDFDDVLEFLTVFGSGCP